MQVINPNYNSQWAEILWGSELIGYIQKDCLNYADAYLGYLDVRSQQDIKQAKKAKLTYSGILKDYDKILTKKEFCRLAVNWYKATGHKLPKQSKKSPFTDTKDPYVIMAYQLGIVKSTKNNKFQPNKELLGDQYDALVKRLLRVAGAPIGLWEKNDDKNQQFRIKEIHGFTLIYNVNSGKALTGTDNEVYQEAIGYDCQKLSFKYNSDGTVSIINGEGRYLDIKDGAAKSGGTLIWASKSGSSTQKWVFTYKA